MIRPRSCFHWRLVFPSAAALAGVLLLLSVFGPQFCFRAHGLEFKRGVLLLVHATREVNCRGGTWFFPDHPRHSFEFRSESTWRPHRQGGYVASAHAPFPPSNLNVIVIPLWPWLAGALVAWVTTEVWRSVPRRDAGRCACCKYDRRGLSSSAPCPECGTFPGPVSPSS